jgi:catecholate siderophore receptor
MKQFRTSSQLDLLFKGSLFRTVIGTAVGVSATGSAYDAEAQTADTLLPTVSVEGAAAPTRNSGYQTSMPSLDKLTQPLLDTPQSISVVPRQLLDDQGVTTLRDALRDVPGVSLAAGEGGQQGDNLSIRGFNAQNDFYLDGMRDFGSYSRDPFNLQSVEVLKGPASVLFGRGSTGGIINQVSKQATLAPVTIGTLSFGTDGTKRTTIDMDRAVSGTTGTAVRLNAMVDDAGVAGRDVARNRRFGIAPQIAFGLGSDTRLKLSYLHQQGYDTPDYGIPWLNGRPAPVARQNFYGFADHDHFRTDVDIGTARLEHDFNDSITVASQTRYGSYRRNLSVTEPLITGYTASQDIVNPNVPLGSIRVNQHIIGLNSTEGLFDHQDDATFHFRTGTLEHTVVAGIEVLRQTSTPTRVNLTAGTTSLLYPDSSIPFTTAQPVTSIQTAIANNYAAYVTDTVKIGSMFEVIGGWRFDRYDSTFKQIIKPAVYVSRDDDMPTWRAALVFKPVDYASIYGAYGTSFDPSAEALSLSASTAAVAPEKSRNYEVGAKLDVLNRRLSLTTAFYDLAKTNVRETSPIDPTTSVLAGNYRVLGFEVGVTGHITERLQVFGGYSYNDAQVVSSPFAAELHHQPPNAPRHTFGSFVEYHLPWHGIEVGGGLNYVSSRTASSFPVTGTTIIERAPGYVLGQLLLKAPINERLTLQVNVTNINNAYYYDGLHPGHIIVGPSRAALFTLTAKL